MNAPPIITRDRSKFIGGSDAAAVLGVSPYATPVELWMQKTGRTPKEEPDAARLRVFARGKKLEPYVLEMVIDKLVEQGHDVELLTINALYVDPDYPFLACEIDFELMLDGEHINGDCKTVHGFARKKWGEEETEEVPIEYAAQFMHGLAITGRSRCLVAALIGLDDVAIYWVNRDEETIDAMRHKEIVFWNDCVLADRAPDPIDFDDIKLLFPTDNGQAVEANDEISIKVSMLADVKAEAKRLEEEEEVLKKAIAEFISPNAVLTRHGKEIATWKGQNVNKFAEKLFKAENPDLAAQYITPSIQRVLRLKGKK